MIGEVKMLDKLKEIYKKILAWWNRFDPKQKTAIIIISVAVLLAFVILVTVLSRPQYVQLTAHPLESTKEASEINDMLVAEGITPKVSDDGLSIKVKSSELSQATLLLGKNGISTEPYADLTSVFSGGFTAAQSDTQIKYKAYCESKMEDDFESYDFVRSASVSIELPIDDGTLIAKEEEGFVSIILDLNDELPGDAATGMALFAKNVIGNKTSNNIVIMDTMGNLLYAGEDNYSISGGANSQLAVKNQAENLVKNEVKRVLIGTGNFGRIEVAGNIVVDFSTYEKLEEDFFLPDDQPEGLITHSEIFNASSEGGNAGVPGTDSNGDDNTTYVYDDDSYSKDDSSEEVIDRVVDKTVVSQKVPPGLILYDESSISVTAISYNVVNEENAKKQGLLAGISWDEYKAANSEKKKLEVDEEMYKIVANATGIDADDITIVAYEEPIFNDKAAMITDMGSIVQIVLIVLILGLLAFVIFKTMKADGDESPDEITVENLLQSIPEESVEQINVDDRSETRKVIEKFVEDNPEAVANLLRNWLGEGWG